MARTRSQAVKAALAVTTYPVGWCARFTREALGLPATGDRDGDGDADAVDAWLAAKHRHPGDRNPPAGVPVFWSGGSKNFGHAALSEDDGMIRSTDLPVSGKVGTVALATVEKRWGMKYLGWSEDWAGTLIPLDPSAPPKIKPTPNVDAAIRANRRAGRTRVVELLKRARRRIRKGLK